MPKINRLTREQKSLIPVYRDRWLEIGLHTGPTDHAAAEEACRLAYRCAGLAPPEQIIWAASPHAGVVATASIRDSIGASLRNSLRNSLWASLWDSLWASIGASLWDSLWDSLRDSLRNSLRASLWASIGDSLRASLWDACYGQHDAWWLATYAYADEVLHVAGMERGRGLFAMAQTCGWWWPFERVAVLTEKPIYLERDDRGRLHSQHRAAIEYPDGWGVYAWYGVRMPKEMIVEPGWVTTERIAAERNQEIRRAMIERIGWDAYLTAAGAVEVQRDWYGVLLELPERGVDRRNRFVRVFDPGTRRQYALCVPLETQTAHEGVAWSFGLSADEYAPEQET